MAQNRKRLLKDFCNALVVFLLFWAVVAYVGLRALDPRIPL